MKTLKIEDLSKNFGSTEVLKKINLEIDEGNFLDNLRLNYIRLKV